MLVSVNIAYIACGSASLYKKTLYFFLTVLALSAAATVANIKIRYGAKIPQFAIFGTRVIYVFYSIEISPDLQCCYEDIFLRGSPCVLPRCQCLSLFTSGAFTLTDTSRLQNNYLKNTLTRFVVQSRLRNLFRYFSSISSFKYLCSKLSDYMSIPYAT